jgi:hypothetical protein
MNRFHVDDLSSAHVYLRPPLGTKLELKSIPDGNSPKLICEATLLMRLTICCCIGLELLADCCQLVKANSIEGSACDMASHGTHVCVLSIGPLCLCVCVCVYIKGNKKKNIKVVYTPAPNLKKVASCTQTNNELSLHTITYYLITSFGVDQ